MPSTAGNPYPGLPPSGDSQRKTGKRLGRNGSIAPAGWIHVITWRVTRKGNTCSQRFVRPWPCRNDKRCCLVRGTSGRHLDPIGQSSPTQHPLIEVQFRSILRGHFQLRADALLGKKIPGTFFVDRDIVFERRNGRKPPANLCGRKHGVRNSMRICGNDSSLDKLTAVRTQNQTAGDGQQFRSCIALQLFPKLIGAQNERNVLRAFPIGLANHTRAAVGRAFVMRRGELLDAQDASTTRGKLLRGGTAHCTQSENDNVEGHAGSFGGGAREICRAAPGSTLAASQES